MPEEKKKKLSGGKQQVIKIGLIRTEWFGGKCMWADCEITIGLEFAHAIPTQLSIEKTSGRSSYERLKDLIENPECFLLYCSKHHRIFDNRAGDEWHDDFYSKH